MLDEVCVAEISEKHLKCKTGLNLSGAVWRHLKGPVGIQLSTTYVLIYISYIVAETEQFSCWGSKNFYACEDFERLFCPQNMFVLS